jgi:hypothetical protein
MNKILLIVVLALASHTAKAQYEGVQRDTFFTKGDTIKYVDAKGNIHFDSLPYFVAVKPLYQKNFTPPQYFINNQPVLMIVWRGYYFMSKSK